METLWIKYRRNSRGWRYDNTAQVHSRIIVGPAGKTESKATHMVNCAEECFGHPDFVNTDRYACIDAIDSVDEDITEWYPAFETAMNKFLSDPECKLVYVHCECGINRSAFLTLIYVCIKFGYSTEAVVKSMLVQRPCMFTNIKYREQSIEYIKKHQ
jgi:predicted protein tyrosine phosphatase